MMKRFANRMSDFVFSYRGQRRFLAGVALTVFLCRPTDVEEYLANGWSAEDGLPQNTVTCITQTRDGYLWLGTWNGVVRFDGARFVFSGAHNTSEIKRNRILALQEDRQGGLWIGPEGSGATRLY